MRFELLIDELRLDGFDPSDRHRIRDALETAVARHLQQADLRRIAAIGSDVDVLRAPDASQRTRDGAEEVGAAVGRSLAQRLTGVSARDGAQSGPLRPPGRAG